MGSFDYSQQEPRMIIHYAASIGDGYEGSNELVEAYHNTEADFHQTVADLVGIERSQPKTIGLGLMYGMGKNKLALSLGVSKDEADKLIIKYNNKVPFVKKLSDRCKFAADEKGVIRTKKGRNVDLIYGKQKILAYMLQKNLMMLLLNMVKIILKELILTKHLID